MTKQYGRRSDVYPAEMVAEWRAEAKRLDRPISWVVQRAWRLARKRIRAMAAQGEAKEGS